jgi:uncharacterized protein YeeX (DUF496 family)
MKTRSLITPFAFALATTFALVTSPAHATVSDLIYNVFSGGRTMNFEHKTASYQLKMRVVDAIYFTPNEDDVAKLDGRAMIQETRNGRTQRIEFKPDGNGGVKRTYRINNREQPFDAGAQRWLATVIPTVYREMAIDHENRLKRIYASGGFDAAMAEIERIESNHSRSKYISGLAALGKMDDKRLQRLLDATEKMTGDFDRKNALLAIVGTQALNAAGQTGVLNAVAKMDSDFDQRSVLEVLAPKLLNDATVTTAWRAALKKISSDFDVKTIVESMTKRDTLTPREVELAIEATAQLSNDFERSTALKSIVRHLGATPAQTSEWLKSAQKINGNFERKEALIALITKVEMDKATYNSVFQIIDGMDGDFEKRNVLDAVAKRMPRDTELVARYRQTARSLNDHERGQAEKALDRSNM